MFASVFAWGLQGPSQSNGHCSLKMGMLALSGGVIVLIVVSFVVFISERVWLCVFTGAFVNSFCRKSSSACNLRAVDQVGGGT